MPGLHETVQRHRAKMMVVVTLPHKGLFFFHFPFGVAPFQGPLNMAEGGGQNPCVGGMDFGLWQVGKLSS